MRLGRLQIRLLPRDAGRAPGEPHAARLAFRCNVCGQTQEQPVAALERERPSCAGCGSNVRFRSLVAALSERLFGRSVAAVDFPQRKDLAGIGMTDWSGYRDILGLKFDYRSTYLHKPPRLDILAPAEADLGAHDFLLSSDVFEHVLAPVQRAFDNAWRLLKPGGVFVMTVPYCVGAPTREHFGEMTSFAIEDGPEGRVLRAAYADGGTRNFSDLVFHGGDGTTLEMRVFGLADLIGHFERAGFDDIRVHDAPDYDHGILHHGAPCVPISARRP
ncbi:methyltransferase domain-containing protein [Coralloluteibacterium stylophorae]|uniref:Class I SAM-dependent methyltransferase n=1 Tax=Coralloluteibacterium stylophorae TaxID=1776034 RepID=A0A8J7VQS8_9GAMM|nr:class I SAM-dependent methyltransferase [Coralloluteibacterium stylophorae]MBS7455555.1 class I SAM-dependent methyltransferase [Coralloluteibacterium stylophorae]